ALLRRLPDAVGQRVDRACDAAGSRIAASVTAPLQEALEAACAAHARAIAGLEPDGPPPADRRAAREAAERCRLAIHQEVLEPLAGRLREAAPGEALEAAFEELLGRLAGLDRGLPARVEATEAPEVFDPEPADGPLRAARKTLARGRRRLASGRARTREVPLGALLDFHLRARLPAALAPLREESRQAAALPLARLETAVTAWRTAALGAEARLESPADRVPEDLAPAPDGGTGEEAAATAGLAGELLGVEPAAGRAATAEGADGDGPSPVDELAAAGEAARALGAALQAARDALAAGAPERGPREAAAAAGDALRRDLARAGTWLLPEKARGPRAAARERARATAAAGHGGRDPGRVAAAWRSWHGEAERRIALELAALRNWKVIGTIEADHVSSLAGRAVSPLLTAARAAAGELRRAAERLEAAERPDPDLVEEVHTALRAALREDLLDRLETAPPGAIVRAEADRVADRMVAANHALPESVEVHPLPAPDGPVDPFAPVRTLRPREAAEQARDAFLVERLRTAAEPLAAALDEAAAAARDAVDAVEYGFDAAEREGEDPGAAGELLRHALAAGADGMERLAPPLRAALAEFARAAAAPYAGARAPLLERLAAEPGVQEQLAGVGSRLRGRIAALRGRIAERVARATGRLAAAARTARERVRRWLHLGAHAVGPGDIEADAGVEDAIGAVAGVGRLLGRAPLVYQRLFTLRPLPGPDLLVGRAEELDTARRHLERWHEGLTDALVVVAPHAGGKTSFLNAVEKTILDGEEPARVVLQERIESERALAARISEALALDPPASDLGELEAAIRDGRAGGPRTVFIENLEHLLLRVVGGAALIERTLTFLSATDARIRWIVTVTEHGWEYVELALESVGSLPRVLRLHALGRDEMEEALLARHRRSGLGVQFEPPESPGPLLARRLRRAGSEKERQAVLRGEWFDRLQRTAGCHPILAIFYWLRAADFDAARELLHVRPLRPLDFSYIQRLDGQQAFVLKALLQHTTLCLSEAERVFGLEPSESHRTFESLANLLLIEEAGAAREADRIAFARITREDRYRVRPLLVHPVTQALRARHILH
ncbi:MAG: hypothetical protein RRA92_09760, partial [Gemmatimonadota bacterium]|nr:hypothetical protein [Gemmatimonadota bacterium]